MRDLFFLFDSNCFVHAKNNDGSAVYKWKPDNSGINKMKAIHVTNIQR